MALATLGFLLTDIEAGANSRHHLQFPSSGLGIARMGETEMAELRTN